MSDHTTPIKPAVECYVELAGITVAPSLLNRSMTVKMENCAYRIEFPSEPDSFKFPHATVPHEPAEREYEATQRYVGDPQRGFVAVRIIRILLNATFDDPGLNPGSPERDQWDQTTFYDLLSRVLNAARDVTDLVRVRGQAAIKPTGRYPRILNLARLVELDGAHAHSSN